MGCQNHPGPSEPPWAGQPFSFGDSSLWKGGMLLHSSPGSIPQFFHGSDSASNVNTRLRALHSSL